MRVWFGWSLRPSDFFCSFFFLHIKVKLTALAGEGIGPQRSRGNIDIVVLLPPFLLIYVRSSLQACYLLLTGDLMFVILVGEFLVLAIVKLLEVIAGNLVFSPGPFSTVPPPPPAFTVGT